MALSQQPMRPRAWGCFQQQPAVHDYSMMNHPTSVQDQSRAAMPAPMARAVMPTDYLSAPPYYMISHNCPALNHMTYTQNDAPQTYSYMSPRVVRVGTPEHEGVSGQNGRQRSPISSSKARIGSFKTPDPRNTKDIRFNKPTGAESVNFTTPIDTLMKAIQKRSDSDEIIKVASENHQVKPEPRSPTVGHKAIAPTTSSMSAEGVGAPKAKRFICGIGGCGKSFAQSTHLDTHKRAHTGAKPYQCNWPHCERTFSQPGNLKTHMRRHTGEKPFQCEGCDKVFAQRGNLQTHMATHTDRKPFNHQNKNHGGTLLEMTDWIVSITDVNSLSDDQRKMYYYFANLYKNSNKGIKGRGKDRRVTERVSKAKRKSPYNPINPVSGSISLAACNSKRLPSTEQQQQRHHPRGYHEGPPTDMALFSSESCDRHNVAFANPDGMYWQPPHAMYTQGSDGMRENRPVALPPPSHPQNVPIAMAGGRGM
ncbi:hypothetical protein CORC01_10806 [Colletotrichum orchidophilum]|uniref:C2H2-type domain-containing protein n=1 Tax=Colletotrichum orchidophilum TaxID=1209926 RepID=A0A1G4AXP4_9PEZI|nr:uncharacterized protein CORC01_10806 [Colletotrichum orchidophilum]OHE93907.1 hypothetical protein CORC01_10806 [Colletotrichum orchidophilum]